jgi:hypothetical protein
MELKTMKNPRLLIVSLFLLATPVLQAYQSQIEIVEQFDHLRVVAIITATDITDSPQWNPNRTPEPPLTIADAVQAVHEFAITQNVAKTQIEEIELRAIPNHEQHWHYLIKTTDHTTKLQHRIYVVLMTGQVIPAIIEPNRYQ